MRDQNHQLAMCWNYILKLPSSFWKMSRDLFAETHLKLEHCLGCTIKEQY